MARDRGFFLLLGPVTLLFSLGLSQLFPSSLSFLLLLGMGAFLALLPLLGLHALWLGGAFLVSLGFLHREEVVRELLPQGGVLLSSALSMLTAALAYAESSREPEAAAPPVVDREVGKGELFEREGELRALQRERALASDWSTEEVSLLLDRIERLEAQ